jgi:outer membrane protein OmpA-like peptidoglycan-associated protein
MRSPQRRIPPLVAGLLMGILLLIPVGPAQADDTAPVRPIKAPVRTIVAPVLDISFGEADLRRTARVDKTPRRTTITLDSTVLFARDSPKINSRARGRLREVGRQLKGNGAGSVKITGYTDDLGTKAHGLTLSRQRARAVATVLRRSLPASSFRFTVRGLGESHPAVPNTSEHNRKINRRVVVVYQKR